MGCHTLLKYITLTCSMSVPCSEPYASREMSHITFFSNNSINSIWFSCS